jgi:hypothetical protein
MTNRQSIAKTEVIVLNAGVSTQKVAVMATASIADPKRADNIAPRRSGEAISIARSVPKESQDNPEGLSTRVLLFMALTFGTLLSSQGADAHRHDPFGAIRGNLSYTTRSVPHGQTRPALPELPLGRGGSEELAASCLGELPPGSTRPSPLGAARCVAPSRGQVQH